VNTTNNNDNEDSSHLLLKLSILDLSKDNTLLNVVEEDDINNGEADKEIGEAGCMEDNGNE